MPDPSEGHGEDTEGQAVLVEEPVPCVKAGTEPFVCMCIPVPPPGAPPGGCATQPASETLASLGQASRVLGATSGTGAAPDLQLYQCTHIR